mmetsp:Transcript_9443/g.18420  ORF Transcript_9443/g.18420 Transcript_9443/m.18420 type:complete len:215 (+) Transcript_9443:1134-1778(+)
MRWESVMAHITRVSQGEVRWVLAAVLLEHILGPSRADDEPEVLPELQHCVPGAAREHHGVDARVLVFVDAKWGLCAVFVANVVARTHGDLERGKGKARLLELRELSLARAEEPRTVRMHNEAWVSERKRIPDVCVTLFVTDDVLPARHRYRARMWRGGQWLSEVIGLPVRIGGQVALQPRFETQLLAPGEDLRCVLRKVATIEDSLYHSLTPRN